MNLTSKYPFPFFGAGLAHYYEWFNATIRFQNKLTVGQKEIITQSSSFKVFDENEGEDFNFLVFTFSEDILEISSSQFVNLYIQMCFGNPEEVPEFEEEDEIYFFVSPNAEVKFQEELERWLLEINKIAPIEFVYRGIDLETEGTEFSNWHEESCKNANKLFEKWEMKPFSNNDIEINKRIQITLGDIAFFAWQNGCEFSENHLKKYLPEKYTQNLIRSKDTQKLLNYFQEIENNEYIFQSATNGFHQYIRDSNEANEEYDIMYVYELSKTLMRYPAFEIFFRNNADYLFDIIVKNAYEKNDKEMIGILVSFLETNYNYIMGIFYKASYLELNDLINDLKTRLIENFNANEFSTKINLFSYDAYRLLQMKAWKATIIVFEFIFDLIIKFGSEEDENNYDLTLFNNVTYALQHDNSGLAVDNEINKKILPICLRFADKNLNIYFNIGSIYIEMNEFEQALKNFKNYFDHLYFEQDENSKFFQDRINERSILFQQLSDPKNKFFDKFKKHPGVQEYVINLTKKINK